MVDFMKLLKPEQRATVERRRKYQAEQVARFAAMSPAELIERAKHTIDNSEPCRFQQGDCVYDATLRYVILPELLRRVGEA